MAKKENKTAHVESDFLSSLADAAQDRFGAGKFIGKGEEEFCIGIPLPALSLMYLFDSTVFPLGKLVSIAGFYQSSKSGLGFEIARWFAKYGGYTQVVECENKISIDLVRSIMGDYYPAHLRVARAEALEEAQAQLKFSVQYVKEHTDKDKMILLDLDSVSGADTEESLEKIEKEGSAGRSHPDHALSWSRWLKGFTSKDLSGWPISMIAVNHLKEKGNPMPGLPPQKTAPGGAAWFLHSAWYFWVSRIGKEQRMTRYVDGEFITCPQETRRISIECHKTSFGTDARSIAVDFVWYWEGDKQVSYFDWNASTAQLLSALQMAESKEIKQIKGLKKGFEKGALQEIVDVKVSDNLYTSKRLDVERVPPSEFGRLVNADQKLMDELLSFFHVHKHKVFEGIVEAKPVAKPAEPAKAPEVPKMDPKAAAAGGPDV